jgi:hypothetical protein
MPRSSPRSVGWAVHNEVIAAAYVAQDHKVALTDAG